MFVIYFFPAVLLQKVIVGKFALTGVLAVEWPSNYQACTE